MISNCQYWISLHLIHRQRKLTSTHPNVPKSIPQKPPPSTLCSLPCNSMSTHYASIRSLKSTVSCPDSFNTNGIQIIINKSQIWQFLSPILIDSNDFTSINCIFKSTKSTVFIAFAICLFSDWVSMIIKWIDHWR